jgi:hypothetical protein
MATRKRTLVKSKTVLAADRDIEAHLLALFGPQRVRKLQRFAQQTGRTLVSLLEFGIDLVECHLQHLPGPKKNPEAVALGEARWANISKEQRAAVSRAAVNARWAKYRAEKAKGSPTGARESDPRTDADDDPQVKKD